MNSQIQVIQCLKYCRSVFHFGWTLIQYTHASNSEIGKSGLFILSFNQMQAYGRKIKA